MSKAATLIIGLAGLLTTSASFLSAAEPGVRELDTVAKVAVVTTRDGNGRAQRFTDTGNREFAVTYDDQQRVQSVEAAHGPHVTDIISIGYTENGKVTGARFRTGYTVYFDRRPDGPKVIRDSRGGAVMRAGTASQGVEGAPVEQSDRIGPADALIHVVPLEQ